MFHFYIDFLASRIIIIILMDYVRFRCYSLPADLSALFHRGFLSRPIEDFNDGVHKIRRPCNNASNANPACPSGEHK